jgi:hypothetical protein
MQFSREGRTCRHSVESPQVTITPDYCARIHAILETYPHNVVASSERTIAPAGAKDVKISCLAVCDLMLVSVEKNCCAIARTRHTRKGAIEILGQRSMSTEIRDDPALQSSHLEQCPANAQLRCVGPYRMNRRPRMRRGTALRLRLRRTMCTPAGGGHYHRDENDVLYDPQHLSISFRSSHQSMTRSCSRRCAGRHPSPS